MTPPARRVAAGLLAIAMTIAACDALPSDLPPLPSDFTLPSGLPSLPAELPPLPSCIPGGLPLPSALPADVTGLIPTCEPDRPTERPTPTTEPSEAPTEVPTEAPTTEPTGAPTPAPTTAPTVEPTSAPTARPTAEPTAKPTSAPSAKPTSKPTSAPTTAPTPTANATASPSPTPSPSPSPSPTPSPTPTPTPAALEARFYASSIEGDAPLLIAFANLSSGAPTAQLWTFGDGRISFDTHPTHVYQDNGLYTVTLTIVSPDGQDSRVKEDLIAVGPAARLAAARQVSVTDQPVWWLTLAVSPWIAGAWLLVDRLGEADVSLPQLVRNGRALATLVDARDPDTSVGALDVAVERFLTDALIARRRSDPTVADLIGRSSDRLDGLRQALLLEAVLRSADASGDRLTQAAADVQERLQEFIAAIEALDRQGGS